MKLIMYCDNQVNVASMMVTNFKSNSPSDTNYQKLNWTLKIMFDSIHLTQWISFYNFQLHNQDLNL